jgi:hypothetical protein
MTLDKLVKIADRGYYDGLVWAYYKDPDGDHGDTLAQFIALEIADTYDPEADDVEQLLEVARALTKAEVQLAEVVNALYVGMRGMV